MIPIYRAKKIDSDEYVIGYYVDTVDFIGKTLKNKNGYISYQGEWKIIDKSTLAIHFPFMIDNDKNKLFASLKGKKGASKVLIKFNEDFSNDCVTVDEGSFIECFIKFENGGLFFEEQDSTWYYLDDILNLDCEITEIGIEE